jgi:hypothetical protein
LTRRLAVLALALAALPVLNVPSAPAAGTLNSTCTPPGAGFVIVSAGKGAQTFVAGSSGKLLTADILQLARAASPTDPPVLVEVFGADVSGTPVAPALASTTIAGASINDDNFFHGYTANFDPLTAAYLSEGATYAVAVSTTDSVQNSWSFGNEDPCADVGLYAGFPPPPFAPLGDGYDAGLRTYLGPSNDDFARAIALNDHEALVAGTTAGGTRELGEPDHYTIGPEGDPELWTGEHTVWYRWTAPHSGPAEIDTCTSTIDSILAVYTGSALNALTRVTDNNNDIACAGGNVFGSMLSFTAVGGTQYLIAVGDAGGATQNTFTLDIAGSPPPPVTPPVKTGDPAPAIPGSTAVGPPETRILKARISGKLRRATFRFGSSAAGATFRCKLDRKPFVSCASPKTYRRLKPGRHSFQVQSLDPAGGLDATAATRRFRISG